MITRAAAFVLGITWWLVKGGAPALDPRRYGWLIAGDWGLHQLGWMFYRRDGWHFPLGIMTNFPDPTGATTGFTDSIPWVALALKPWARLLPAQFQYLGPWMALSFGLQGLFGVLIVERLTPVRWAQLVGGLLFVVAPLFLFRVFHVALNSHFLLLAALWIYLCPVDDAPALHRSARRMGLVLIVAAGVHPYLLVMTAALACGWLLRLWLVDGRLRPLPALGLFSAFAAASTATLYLLGYFTGADPHAGGYRELAADLLTFVNPQQRGTLLPSLPVLDLRYEGLAYLGVGVLAMALLALARLAGDRELRRTLARQWPLWGVCGVLALFAFSTRLTMGRKVLLDFDLPLLHPLQETFRAAGRFIWPLHDAILIGVIAATVALLRARPRLLVAVLAAALALQLVDQRGIASAVATEQLRYVVPSDARWQAARGSYRRLAMVPPILAGCPTQPGWPTHDYIPLGFLADGLDLTIDSADLSRPFPARQKAYCAALDGAITAQRWAPDTIYVVHPSQRDRFAGATCGSLDGRTVCVAPDRHDRFAAALGAR